MSWWGRLQGSLWNDIGIRGETLPAHGRATCPGVPGPGRHHSPGLCLMLALDPHLEETFEMSTFLF